MTLGQKLKQLRFEKDLTQKELADRLHVSFQTVSKWENGENEPDIATLKELAALFNCSVDYLIGSEKEEVVPASQPQAQPQTVIVQKELHVCAKCGQDIPEEELVSEDVTQHKRVGRHTRSVSVGQTYYHKHCLEEVEKERAETARRVKAANTKKAKKLTLVWSIVAGVVALGIALASFLCNMDKVQPGLGVLYSFIIAYGIFSMIYCILSGSYIGDVFMWCSGLSIRFPGLIFSWDIEGFIWVITMKIFFAILAFLFGILTLLFAIIFSASLGMFSFPFVLIHNIHTGYEDSVFMPYPLTGGGSTHHRAGRR